MLTLKETSALLEILAEGKSLEAASLAFQRAFVRAEHFRVAAAVCVLLEEGLLPAKQRTTALFIIHDLYKAEAPGVHPFMPFLVGMLQSPPAQQELRERNLLCQLLSQSPGGPVTSSAKKTPAELDATWPATGGELLPLPNLVRQPARACAPRVRCRRSQGSTAAAVA